MTLSKWFKILINKKLILQEYDTEAKQFENRLRTALVNNQHGFVKLFLANGVINIDTFLTENELIELYAKVI